MSEGVRDVPCVLTLTGTRPSARCARRPRRSGPWCHAARVRRGPPKSSPGRPPRPPGAAPTARRGWHPGRWPWRSAWTRSPRSSSTSGWANQKVLDDAKRHAHTRPGCAAVDRLGRPAVVRRGWPGSCHEHELLDRSGLDQVLDAAGVASLLDRGLEAWPSPRARACAGRRPAHQGSADRRTTGVPPACRRAARWWSRRSGGRASSWLPRATVGRVLWAAAAMRVTPPCPRTSANVPYSRRRWRSVRWGPTSAKPAASTESRSTPCA